MHLAPRTIGNAKFFFVGITLDRHPSESGCMRARVHAACACAECLVGDSNTVGVGLCDMGCSVRCWIGQMEKRAQCTLSTRPDMNGLSISGHGAHVLPKFLDLLNNLEISLRSVAMAFVPTAGRKDSLSAAGVRPCATAAWHASSCTGGSTKTAVGRHAGGGSQRCVGAWMG